MIQIARPRPLRPSLALALAGLLACTEGPSATTGASASPGDAAVAEAASSGPEAPALPDAAALLAASVEALGGADKLMALRSYYSESQITMSAMGLSGVAKTWWKGGDFYTEIDIPGVGQNRLGSLGDAVWGDDPINGLREITGVEAEQARWSSTPCVVHHWQKYFTSATTTALVQDGGRELAEILLVSPLGDRVTLRIDTATKMPVSQSFAQANPLGAMPVTATFADFREVEGFKISFAQEVDATLSRIVSTTTRFDANVDVDPTKFTMPGPDRIGKDDLHYADAPPKDTAAGAPADLKKPAGAVKPGKPGKPAPEGPRPGR